MKALAFLFLLLTHYCFAQNHFYGTLIDEQTGQSIPFGHFSYEGNKGFISDENGQFELYATAETIQIRISAIGYQNHTFLLKAAEQNIVGLKSKTENLQEVILDYVDPAKELIRNVVAAIPKNYPTQQEQIYGTYREDAYWDSLYTQPIYKAETLTKADKFSYAKKETDGNVQILEHKLDVIDMDSVELRIYGGVHDVHYDDFVLGRHGPLKLSKLNDYDLKIKDTLEYDGRPVIQLNYSNKKSKGELYIDVNSFALIRATRVRNPKEIEEDFNLFNFYERLNWKSLTSYDIDPDGKWRLKFIHYNTGFKRKNNTKSFYLNTTYFATQHLSERTLIPQNERFAYSAVLSDYLLSQKENKSSITRKQAVLLFFSKLRSSLNVGLHPFQINSHQFEYVPLSKEINFNESNILVWVWGSKIEYPINNKWGFSWSVASSFKKNIYSSNALGLDFYQDLSRRNRVHLNASMGIGYRKMRASHGSFTHEDSFKIKSKTFDSEEFSLFTEEREFYLNPRLGIDFRISPLFRLGFDTTYFITLQNATGVFSYEEDEFWFWNRAKTFQKNTIETAGSSIIENQFATRLTLTFNY
ncbi:carboxypeptidase-like regulatory domain-containing protein [Flavobacteriaceae bacterium]|nr:carboxypeptidase-like regulatory domain-containing protein [Flavobacteriaceae bacterium]